MATRTKKVVGGDQDYKARAKKRAAAMTMSVWYKLKEGDNTFRVLPTPKSKKTPGMFHEYAIHRDVGPRKQSVTCGRDPVTDEGACWLCDVQIPKLRKAGKDRRADALAFRAVFVIQVARVEEDGGDLSFSGPFIFSPSKGVATQLLTTVFNSKRRDYLSPTKGYNITMSRTGTGFKDTKYGMLEADADSSEVPEALIAKLKPFSDLKEIVPYDEAKQKSVYTGEEPDDDDEDEDEAPKRRRRGSSNDDDDEDEDEDDDSDSDSDDDDEDDEPASKKAARRAPAKGKSSKSDEDDEDEDEDDEDDEPKKSSKKPTKGKVVEDDDDDDLDEDEDEDDEDEDDAPPAKGKSSKAKKPEPDEDEDEDEDDDLDDDDEDDAPTPAKGKGKAPAKSKKPVVEDEDEDDDLDDEDDEDEDEDDDGPPAKRGTKKAPPAKKTAKKK